MSRVDEINLRTDLFSSRTQVLQEAFSRNSFQQQFKGLNEWWAIFFLFKIKIFVLKKIRD